MSTPFVAVVGTYVGGAGAAQSGFVTFSFQNTAGFEVFNPIQITNPGTTSISAGAEVTLYRTGDNGATWETQGTLVGTFLKPTTASQVQRLGVYIPTGQWLVSVQVGGGATSTWTAQQLTAQILSGYS